MRPGAFGTRASRPTIAGFCLTPRPRGRSRIFVAPFRSGGLIPESEWIPITDGVWDDKPRWSPDGNTYFMSERDRFRCIWAHRLDASKHPEGAAIPIFHAHEARRSLLNVQVGALEMAVARDNIVFNMSERTGECLDDEIRRSLTAFMPLGLE